MDELLQGIILMIPILAIVVLSLIHLFLGGQVECKVCGWFMQYTFCKPRNCKRCGEKMAC